MMDYKKSCRMCLKSTSKSDVNLFKADKNGRCWAKDLQKGIHLHMKDRPNWPQQACPECVEFLKKMVNFWTMIRTSFATIERGLGMKETQSQVTIVKEEVVKKSPAKAIPIEDGPWDDPFEDSLDGIDSCSIDPPVDQLPVKLQDREEDEPSVKRRKGADKKNNPGNPEIINPQTSSGEKLYPEDKLLESPEKETAIPESDQLNISGTSSDIIFADDEIPFSDFIVESETSADEGTPINPPLTTEEEKKLDLQIMDMKLLECNICGEDTQTWIGLKQHVREQHSAALNTYKVCCNLGINNRFYKPDLYEHIRFHLDETLFKCTECEYRGTNSRTFKHHMQKHKNGPQAFICDICGNGYSRKTAVERHRKKHNRVQCKYCKKEFAETNLPAHIQRLHEMVVKYICELCGRGFPNQSFLNVHIMDHGGPHGGRRKKKPKGSSSRTAQSIDLVSLNNLFKN